MFSPDFYPTSHEVFLKMIDGYDIANKVVYEPEAGKGDIIDYCLEAGTKEVIASELHPELRTIVESKCRVIAPDFLTVTSDMISHIDLIIMNPPFSADEHHINHAWNICPAGCTIISLCNYATYDNDYSRARKQLRNTVENYGSIEDLGNCFANAERSTAYTQIGLIKLHKPGNKNYDAEFNGFFLDEEPEQVHISGIMKYDAIRDLVNRYVAAIKIFDEQLQTAAKLHSVTNNLLLGVFSIRVTQGELPYTRLQFKKDLQKASWKWIFDKLNMQKYATKGLKEDINKFVEQQSNIPFTMKNIYRMLEIVIYTQEQRMDKAIEEVFDKLTRYYHENRYDVEGWKTNSHYLINDKFILPGMCYQDQRWHKGESKIQLGYGGNFDLLEDLIKALCYITSSKYEGYGSLHSRIRYKWQVITDDDIKHFDDYEHAYHDCVKSYTEKLYTEGRGFKIENIETAYGKWFEFSFFKVKAFKKGTMHFEFLDKEVWAKLCQRIAKIKGYPLPEFKTKSKMQQRKFDKEQEQFKRA